MMGSPVIDGYVAVMIPGRATRWLRALPYHRLPLAERCYRTVSTADFR
jgi:hypothetical protein